MSKTNTFSVLFLLTFIFSAWTIQTPWEEFVSIDGKFRIMMPGTVTKKVNEIDTPIGKLSYHTVLHQPVDEKSDNLVYMVSYCEYPLNAIHSDSIYMVKDFFETTVNTAVESVDGVLQYSSEINLRDYPGRIWKLSYNEGKALIKTKAFLIKNRYYSIQTITLQEKSLNISTDRFLDSFELID